MRMTDDTPRIPPLPLGNLMVPPPLMSLIPESDSGSLTGVTQNMWAVTAMGKTILRRSLHTPRPVVVEISTAIGTRPLTPRPIG